MASGNTTFSGTASAGGDTAWPTVWTLAQREVVRFLRQRSRVMSALGTPILFWLLFGAGLGPTFQWAGSDQSYSDYFFPGTIVLILLFTAIFTTISVIEDRREGFLQSVLVAPIPRWSMVLGKLLGGSAIAAGQGMLFVLVGIALGLRPGVGGLFWITVLVCLISFALTGLGFAFAWRMDSMQGFHAVMNVVLLPMWLLSGSFFPAAGGLLGLIVSLNPLTYGVAALRRLMYSDMPPTLAAQLPSAGLSWLAMLIFAAATYWASCRVAARRTTGDLL